MKKNIVRGFKKDNFTPQEIQSAKESKLELKTSYQFSTSRALAPVHELSFDKTDILEFVFDDDTTWVGGSEIIHDIFPEAANQKRAAGESFEIPMYLKTKVWNMAGSQNKKITEIEHFGILISAYETLVKKPANVKMLRKIRQKLEEIIK